MSRCLLSLFNCISGTVSDIENNTTETPPIQNARMQQTDIRISTPLDSPVHTTILTPTRVIKYTSSDTESDEIESIFSPKKTPFVVNDSGRYNKYYLQDNYYLNEMNNQYVLFYNERGRHLPMKGWLHTCMNCFAPTGRHNNFTELPKNLSVLVCNKCYIRLSENEHATMLFIKSLQAPIESIPYKRLLFNY